MTNVSNTDFFVSREDGASCFHFDGTDKSSRQCPTFDAAVSFAVSRAASDGAAYVVDVCCYDQAAAKAFGCEDEYLEDPDASVTQRIVIRAENKGRVA